MPERELYLSLMSEGLRARPDGLSRLSGLSRICFFVHGYNVTPEEGKRAFDDLVRLTRSEARVDRDAAIGVLDGHQAWRIYWPAYGRLGRNRAAFSALTYPWHLADAEEWAR